ncbi:putative collagen-binding domain-containing protein [Planctomycetota bacterium]
MPVWEMTNADDLVEGDAFCLAKAGGPYLVVLKTGGSIALDLSQATGELKMRWFNPRTGEFVAGKPVKCGRKVTLGPAASEEDQDWIVLLD